MVYFYIFFWPLIFCFNKKICTFYYVVKNFNYLVAKLSLRKKNFFNKKNKSRHLI